MNRIGRRTLICMAIIAIVAAIIGPVFSQPLDMREAAIEFSAKADACLLDVRDRGLTFEGSFNCRELGWTSKRYIDAGGFSPSTPTDIALIAERGKSTAWTARALSAGAPPYLW